MRQGICQQNKWREVGLAPSIVSGVNWFYGSLNFTVTWV
jgi:hypothetical protein